MSQSGNSGRRSDGSRYLMGTDLRLLEFYEDKSKTVINLQDITDEGDDVDRYYYLGADLSWDDRLGNAADLRTISDDSNLEQAILHRIRTVKGELADTGHPDYGCEIYKLIGEPNTERTRDLIKLMVRDALLQESRVKEILGIKVTPRRSRGSLNALSANELNSVDIDIVVRPVTGNTNIAINMPFGLEGT